MSATETHFELGQVGGYTLLELLGDGAHGSTYLARTEAGGAEVAVKVLARHLTRQQFRDATAALSPAIGVAGLVELFEAGRRADGTAYLAMRYHPLGSLASPPRQLRQAEVLAAISHAARAAHRLHQVGLVHGAIRPSNILLTEDGACLAEPDFTQAVWAGMSLNGRSAHGALQYVEPAHLGGAPAGRASDIWALGVTIHVALTGKPVLGRLPEAHAAARVRAQMEEAPSIDPGLPPAYAQLIRACLAPDRADRPATAEEVARELDKAAPSNGAHAPVLERHSRTSAESSPPSAHGHPVTQGPVVPRPLTGTSHEVVPLATSADGNSADGNSADGNSADPLPLTRHQAAPRQGEGPSASEVDGVLCTRGHFNDLDTRYCHLCGMSMLEGDRTVVRGSRPPLGVLIVDDGTAFHLDMDYVIGADPHREPGCEEGRARALVLQDGDGSIAPVQVAIEISGWTALAVDRGAGTGTRVILPGSSSRELQPGERLELPSHSTIAAGGRTVTFYSHHRR